MSTPKGIENFKNQASTFLMTIFCVFLTGKLMFVHYPDYASGRIHPGYQ